MSPRALSLPLLLAALASCGGASAPSPATPARDAPPPSLAAAIDQAVASESGASAVVPIAPDDAARGAAGAFVTVVVFSDFECPGCRALSRGLDKLLGQYRTDEVRLVFKNFPLRQHRHARMAAEVGQGIVATKGSSAFFRYHDLVFGRPQGTELDRDTLLAWAKEAGADPKQIDRGLEEHTWTAKIERDLALGRQLDIAGTPTIYVNGIDIEDENELVRALDDEIAKGKALASKGIPRERIYSQLTNENYKKAPKERREDDAPPKIDPRVWKVPAGTSPVRGSASALVTVVVFSDYACPFCKGVEPKLDRLRKELGDKIRIVWKDSPLPSHERARPAALLARAARAQKGDAAYWDVHDRLFASSPALADSDLEAIAKDAGLDATKAMAFVKANAPNKDLERDEDLIEEVGASGTPHMFVNGRRIVGNQTYEAFKNLADEELAKAEALVSSGTAPAAVYETTIKSGVLAPEPKRVSVALPEKAPFRGAAGAKVVIQEFSDFQCPFCKRAEPTIDAVLAAYPGKVKVVWRDMPLDGHADAEPAAEAAREAFAQKGNDGFQKMRVKLFENQAVPGGLARPALEQYAKDIGLDGKRFAKALDEHVHKAAIAADKSAASAAGIDGTPAFVVGGYLVSGAKPMRTFRRWIERSFAEGGK